MIRPVTCLSFLLACGSGLYVYQTKHRVKLLDEQITQTIRSTDALREQTRMLSAEWTLLNDPERLRQLANQFLTLQTVSPTQFTSLTDLDGRLPPPAPPGPPPGTAANVTATASSLPAPDGASRTAADEGKPADARPADIKLTDAPSPALPKDAASPAVHVPPSAPARITMTASAEPARPSENKPVASRFASVAPPPRPAVSQPRPPEPRAPEPILAEARPAIQPLRAPSPPPMPQPTFQPAGSFLGMAHGMSSPPAPMPLPRPMPVSIPQWSSGAGG
jgi:hypothetical protein